MHRICSFYQKFSFQFEWKLSEYVHSQNRNGQKCFDIQNHDHLNENIQTTLKLHNIPDIILWPIRNTENGFRTILRMHNINIMSMEHFNSKCRIFVISPVCAFNSTKIDIKPVVLNFVLRIIGFCSLLCEH